MDHAEDEPRLYAAVQHHLARQYRLLDERDYERFAETLAERCSLEFAGGPSLSGRTGILAALRRTARSDEGSRRRHWLGAPILRLATDGGVEVEYPTVVSVLSSDRPIAWERPNIVRDELERHGASLRTVARRVAPDYPAPSEAGSDGA
jgi:hypothetical protein